MSPDADEAAPLRLKLRMREAERDTLVDDLERVQERLSEVEKEISELSRHLDQIGRRSRVRRVK